MDFKYKVLAKNAKIWGHRDAESSDAWSKGERWRVSVDREMASSSTCSVVWSRGHKAGEKMLKCESISKMEWTLLLHLFNLTYKLDQQYDTSLYLAGMYGWGHKGRLDAHKAFLFVDFIIFRHLVSYFFLSTMVIISLFIYECVFLSLN